MNHSLQKLEEDYSIEAQSKALYADGLGYMKVLEGHLEVPSRFDVKLLHNIANMAFEKLMVSLLAYYGIEALNHTPVALFAEAVKTEKLLTENMRQTARSLQKHESICVFVGTGYTVPEADELRAIIHGLIEIRDFVGARVAS